MLGHAERRLGDWVELRLHDPRKPLDFIEDASIDLVVSPLVLDYIEDWAPVMVMPVIEAGVRLDRLFEPIPMDGLREKEPEDYEKLLKQPGFMCIRAVKR
jgi:hypothetical protein